MMFQPEQKVIASIPEAGLVEELATVHRLVPLTGDGYEVTFLADHKPGDALDDVRCVAGQEMRLATMDEIKAASRAWEARHGRPLKSTDQLIPIGDGFGWPS